MAFAIPVWKRLLISSFILLLDNSSSKDVKSKNISKSLKLSESSILLLFESCISTIFVAYWGVVVTTFVPHLNVLPFVGNSQFIKNKKNEK